MPFGAPVDVVDVSAIVATSGILVAVFIDAIAIAFAGHFLPSTETPAYGRPEPGE